MTLYFENETSETFDFSIPEECKHLIHAVCEKYNCPYEVEVSLLLVDTEEIQRLNREFREMDKPTDVLSFPMVNFEEAGKWDSDVVRESLSISPETSELLLGDIVICARIAKEQAMAYGHSEKREFCFLVLHSLLHLFGFDHIEEGERLQMEMEQKQILKELGINRNEGNA